MTEAINENVRDRDSSVSAREQRQREGTYRGEGTTNRSTQAGIRIRARIILRHPDRRRRRRVPRWRGTWIELRPAVSGRRGDREPSASLPSALHLDTPPTPLARRPQSIAPRRSNERAWCACARAIYRVDSHSTLLDSARNTRVSGGVEERKDRPGGIPHAHAGPGMSGAR